MNIHVYIRIQSRSSIHTRCLHSIVSILYIFTIIYVCEGMYRSQNWRVPLNQVCPQQKAAEEKKLKEKFAQHTQTALVRVVTFAAIAEIELNRDRIYMPSNGLLSSESCHMNAEYLMLEPSYCAGILLYLFNHITHGERPIT